jgi:hypothetical protein
MAKTEEEQRDKLFEMNVGDGLIEVNEEETVVETTEEKTDKPKAPAAGDGFSQYEDGSFEIDDSPSETTEQVSNDTDEFIEKTETEETKGKKTPSKTGSSDSSSSSPYLAFARDRANEGVFVDFSEEDWATLTERNDGDEAAALRELSIYSVREMVNAGVENFKQSLSDEERALYEAKQKGLPVDQYSIAKRSFDKYTGISESDLDEDENLQEELVTRQLEMRGFSTEEIAEEIEGYKALEKLDEKAKKALKAVPNAYKKQMDDLESGAQAAEQARQDGIRQRVARMKQTVDNTPEIIPGIKLTKPTRDKIMTSMTVPVAKDENDQPLNPVMATRSRNPDAFEMMIHYYHSLGLFNIDDNGQMKPDFSKIAKVQKTKASDEMRSAFEITQKPIAGKAKAPELSDDELDDFDKAFKRL